MPDKAVSRLEALAMRVADAIIAELRAGAHEDLAFPCRKYTFPTAEQEPTSSPPRVVVDASSSNGYRLHLAAYIVETGPTASATANMVLHMDRQEEKWLAVIHEDDQGAIEIKTLELAA